MYNAILKERLDVIRRTITEYNIDDFMISWSGGKDSQVVSKLIDVAIPGNKIPRVYANTGLDLKIMRDFVEEQAKKDDRIVIIKPSKNVKDVLEKEGYPFKSKPHSNYLERYQRTGLKLNSVRRYLGIHEDGHKWSSQNSCPQILKYQFSDEFKLKVSNACCIEMKEKPVADWCRAHGKKTQILGLMRDEAGNRFNMPCFTLKNDKLVRFSPLAPIDKKWEDWFINEYGVELSPLYLPPYNRTRTGCKGCPFAKDLQKELDVMESEFPAERKQCEYLWHPVYDEYRRIGYRLK